jgi:hypothetical protein
MQLDQPRRSFVVRNSFSLGGAEFSKGEIVRYIHGGYSASDRSYFHWFELSDATRRVWLSAQPLTMEHFAALFTPIEVQAPVT